MKIKSIDHLVITAQDGEASLRFYVDVLGMEPIEGERLAVRFGNQKINIHRKKAEYLPAAENPSYGSADLCFQVEGDLNQIERELEEKGIRLELGGIVDRTGAMGPMKSLYIRDPDGNLIELSSYGDSKNGL